MPTSENHPVTGFGLFRRGQHYAKTWPMEKRLAPVFVENRVIRATRFAIRFMPLDSENGQVPERLDFDLACC